MKNPQQWSNEKLLRSPLFASLHPILAELNGGHFPTLDDLNALVATRPCSPCVARGMPLSFVAQGVGKQSFEAQYEPRCYLAGEVQMRADSWHDLFNALVWLNFPKSKANINSRHYHALMNGKNSLTSAGRGAARDVNTLLDESGVIVAYADIQLAELLRNFQWQELFWQRREQVRAQSSRQAMGFFLFGHGLYEKALHPYVGMTGHGLLFAVEQTFFGWPPEQQLAHLDVLLAEYLADPDHCRSTRELSPVPVLGVPGWSEDNDSAAYYDNTAYFRNGRRG